LEENKTNAIESCGWKKIKQMQWKVTVGGK
jgi:hypothetical protein